MRYLTDQTVAAQEALIKATSGMVRVGYVYELLDSTDTLKKTLTCVQDGLIEYTAFTAFKTSGSLSIIGEDPDVDWINDRIRISAELKSGTVTMRFPLGVYLLSSPAIDYKQATISRSVDIYSKLQILIEDKLTKDTIFAAGLLYTTQITAMVLESGITTLILPSSSAITRRDLEFKAGTSKLDCINELLRQINYTDLNVDNAGYLVAMPYTPVNEREVTWDYIADSNSILYHDASESLNLFNVPNVFVCVASNAESTPLRSEFVNNSISDPTSVLNRKRRIVKYTTVNDIADQATLDSYTQRIADESNDVYGELTFYTGINPLHEWSETLRVQCGTQIRVYEETSWRIELRADGRMTHKGRWLGNA